MSLTEARSTVSFRRGSLSEKMHLAYRDEKSNGGAAGSTASVDFARVGESGS